MITEKHKEALAAIRELKGEKIGASMVLELVDLAETLDANLDAFTAKATEIARAADLVTQERNTLAAEVKELREAQTIPPGWALYEADFSLSSEECPGMVTLVRAGEDFSNWHLLPEADFYVYPLYVYGPGLTYEAALREAIKCAHEVPSVPKGGA